MRVHAAPNGGAHPRVGLSTAGIRGAVERNRLRRRLREAVRPLLPVAEGYDLIVSAGVEALRVPFAELAREVGEATGRAIERARLSRGGQGRPGGQNGGDPQPPRGTMAPHPGATS